MSHRIPAARPDAVQALQMWQGIRANAHGLQIIRRLRGRDELWGDTFIYDVMSAIRLAMRLSRRIAKYVFDLIFGLRRTFYRLR